MSLDQQQLQELLDKWQPRLGLMHWRIQIRWARHHEMEDGCMAQVDSNGSALRANVLVQDPDDYRGDPDNFQHPDMSIEGLIVHELVHLVLKPLTEWIKNQEDANSDIERTVVILERALMEH